MSTLSSAEKVKLEEAFKLYVRANRLPMNTPSNREGARRKWVNSLRRNKAEQASTVGAVDPVMFEEMANAVIDFGTSMVLSSWPVIVDASPGVDVADFLTGGVESGSEFITGGKV